MVVGPERGWNWTTGTREGANPSTGAEEGSPIASAANDVIGVPCVLRGVLGPRGPRGAAGKGCGGQLPPPAPPPPASPSCDVSACPLASLFRSAAPHPQGPRGQAPSPAAHEVPGRCLQCSSSIRDLGWRGVGGGGEREREEASGTPTPSLHSEAPGPSCSLGPPPQPWLERGSAEVWAQPGLLEVIGGVWVYVCVLG